MEGHINGLVERASTATQGLGRPPRPCARRARRAATATRGLDRLPHPCAKNVLRGITVLEVVKQPARRGCTATRAADRTPRPCVKSAAAVSASMASTPPSLSSTFITCSCAYSSPPVNRWCESLCMFVSSLASLNVTDTYTLQTGQVQCKVLPGVYTRSSGRCDVLRGVSQSECQALATAIDMYKWMGPNLDSGQPPGCAVQSSHSTYYLANTANNDNDCQTGMECLCACPMGRYSDRSGEAAPPAGADGCKQCSAGAVSLSGTISLLLEHT